MIKFNEDICIGCYACYVACIAEHNPPEAENAYSFRSIKKTLSKDAKMQKNVCDGCTHCGKCLEACPFGAIYKDEQYGLILTDKDKCRKCRKCQAVCPNDAIRFDADGKMEKCDGCIERLKEGREPACVRACHVKAIQWQ
ncbi:MAG: 4Fe-4S dicluster domain-containing protein [[Clostridium] scindens]|uniref:4Fe-4S dicluster domain-containing protein n=1 Tax=Clostridium scindens (strain JCM 10418 / VPI 12708) TaxID=29347 RepID=UPI0039939B1E